MTVGGIAGACLGARAIGHSSRHAVGPADLLRQHFDVPLELDEAVRRLRLEELFDLAQPVEVLLVPAQRPVEAAHHGVELLPELGEGRVEDMGLVVRLLDALIHVRRVVPPRVLVEVGVCARDHGGVDLKLALELPDLDVLVGERVLDVLLEILQAASRGRRLLGRIRGDGEVHVPSCWPRRPLWRVDADLKARATAAPRLLRIGVLPVICHGAAHWRHMATRTFL